MTSVSQVSRMVVATVGVGTRSAMDDSTSPNGLLEYIVNFFTFGFLQQIKKNEYDHFLLTMADALIKSSEHNQVNETLVVDAGKYSVIFNMPGENNPGGDVSVMVKNHNGYASAKIPSSTYQHVCRAIRFRSEHHLPLSTFLLNDEGSMNLRGVQLPGAHLVGWDFYNADLRDANLSGANLAGADLRLAQLQQAMLPGANMTGARLSNAHASKANLSGAMLENATLQGVFMQGAILAGVKLQRAKLFHADLRDTHLSGADLRYADISNADFSGSDLSGADMSHTITKENRFKGSHLSAARLNMAETNVIADYSEVLQQRDVW